MSFGGVSCHVDVYDDGYAGNVTTLQGAAVPFRFDEEDSDDLLTPIRAKTGYIKVIETEEGVLDGLEPTSAKSRFVECYYGSNVVFSGYLQHQNFNRPYTAYPREVDFPVVSPIGLLGAFDFAPIAPPTAVTLESLLKTVIAGLDAGYTHIITPDVDVFGRTISSFVVSPFNDDFSHLLGTADDLYDPISYEDFMVGLCNAFGWTLHDTPTTLVFAMYEHMGNYVERDLTSFLPITIISGNFVDILSTLFTFADNKATTSVIRPLKEVSIEYSGIRTDKYGLDFSRLKTVSKNSHWDTTGEAAVWLKTLNDEFSGARLLDSTTLSVDTSMFGLADRGVFLCAAGCRSGNEWNLRERILINPDSSWSASENVITVKVYKRPLEAEFNVLVRFSWGDSLRTLGRDMEVNHYCPEAFVRVGELWHHYELDPISGLYEHTWQTLMPVTGETSSQGVYNFDVANCPDGPVEIVFRLSHAYSPGLSLISIDSLEIETSPDAFADYTKDGPDKDTFKGDADGIGEGSVRMLFDDYHETDNMLSGTTLSIDGPDYYTRYAFVLEGQQRLKGKFRHVGTHAIWSDYLCLHRFDGLDWRMIALSFSPIDDEYGIVLQRGESIDISAIVEVSGDNVVIGTTYSGLSCSASGVEWSLLSTKYATIDSATGVMTIKSNAFGHEVTVRATKGSKHGDFTLKVYYSTLDTATFDEVSVVDVTSNLRNGSPGNANNANRVCPTQTIAVNGYKNIYITTSRTNKTGYQYYVNVQLSKLAAGTTTNGNFSNANTNYICEMGRYGSTQDAPAAKLMPLTQVSSFVYGCVAKQASGQTPVSFAYNIQESTDSYYNNCSPLRTTDFTNETIKIHFFK